MVKLRDAEFSDYAMIAKLHAENWQENYRGILSDKFLDHEVEQERKTVWYQRLKFPQEHQRLGVAVLDENIAGFFCLYLNDDSRFGSYVDNLHVSGKWQKTGIGRMLLQECAKQVIRNAGNKKMYLWVYESNVNARKMYERMNGHNFETIEKATVDGNIARVCRYIWGDVSVLL